MAEGSLEDLRWTCPRALNWHGNRHAAELIAEIPTDLGVDRYGAGDRKSTRLNSSHVPYTTLFRSRHPHTRLVLTSPPCDAGSTVDGEGGTRRWRKAASRIFGGRARAR